MIVYQVRQFSTKVDREFPNKAEALAFAASLSGEVELVTWAVSRNLPGAMPPLRYQSCALEVRQDGAWRGVNICG